MAYNQEKNGKKALRRMAMLLPGLLGAAGSFGIMSAAVAQAPQSRLVTANAIGVRSRFDIFIGNGNPGPYTLSWNNLRVGAEFPLTVVLDGQTLTPDAYAVDAVKGVITFKQPVKTTSVVRVTYSYDPKISHRNTSVASAPMTANFLKIAGTDVQVMALPGMDAQKNSANGPLAFGMGKKMNALGGGVTSKFNYAGADSLGMQMGYVAGNARNGVDAGYYRADKALITRFAQTLGYTDAARRWNMGAHLTPSKGMAASFTRNDNYDLAKETGKAQDVLVMRLGVGGATGTLLNFNRTTDTTTDPKKNETVVTTDKMDFAARLTPSTTMAATNLRVNTDVPTPKGNVTTEERTLTFASVSKDQQSNATFTVNTGNKESAGANEGKNNISFRVQAAPVFIVTAQKNGSVVTPLGADGKEGKATSTVTQCLGADIIPMPGAKVSGMVTETETNEIKVSATIVQAQFGTGKTVEFNTGITNRSSETPGPSPLDTTRAQILLRPNKGVTMTGGITWNPENQGVVSHAQRHEWNLTAKSGAWDIGSTYMLTTITGLPKWDDSDPQFGQVSVNCGLRVSRFSRLTTTYSDSIRYRAAASLPATLVPVYTRVMGIALATDLGQGRTLALGTSINENRANTKYPTDKKVDIKLSSRF